MAELADRLASDLKDAMKAGDTIRRETIRYLRSEIHNVEIERKHPLTDDEIIVVIQRQIKQRRDSIEQFSRGGRQDLIDAEEAQIAILEQYLPPQLSADELLELARTVAIDIDAQGPKDMGKVITALRERVGSRAEGRAIASAAQQALAGN